jgi:uncharacterized protein (DUF488 family)
VEIYTIGFTKKTAAEFFGALRKSRIEQLLDVRLNNISQLAGFTKRDDLSFFVQELCHGIYHHEPLLAPTQPILDSYKKKLGTWAEYEESFLRLMADRQIEERLDPGLFAPRRTVLLCSEPTADRCHRRLVVEYLDKTWGNVRAVHL